MPEEKFLVTSALPYANGPIHFGHIAGAYLPADIFTRYKRMTGANIIYICGSDDHGVAITISAEKAGVTPEEHVAKNHALITDIFEKMNIQFDNFSGTSRKPHYEMSQTFFRRINEAGYIEPKISQQLYCTFDKMFLADRYISGICPYCQYERARGDECPNCGKWLEPLQIIEPKCNICGNQPEVRETENWYLKLDKLEPRLKDWIATKKDWKINVLNFVNGWFNEGLQERAITREMSWGIPVPLEGAEGKVLYVWFDAPIGYISSTVEWAKNKGKPDLWKDYWCDPGTRLIHFIGKDNIPFHCIVFPSMIMAQNEVDEDIFVLPENVPANEFYNLEGKQFSKSEGWYIDLDDFFSKYSADVIRYTLCANMPEKRDSEFTWKDFQLRNNSDLADTFGNLANRVLTFTRKNFEGKIPERTELDDEGQELLKKIETVSNRVGNNLDKYEYRRAIFEVMELAREGNRYFDKMEPWSNVKSEETKPKAATTLNLCIHLLKALAVTSCPFIPESAQTLWTLLGIEGQVKDVDWKSEPQKSLKPGTKLPKPRILFKKIEDKMIEEEINVLKEWSEKSKGATETKSFSPLREQVAFDDFAKLDLRVGKITQAETIKKSKKLLKLMIDIGLETRQVVAGIAKQFTPEDLIGKKVIMVANLKPIKLMGVESHGMVMAVKDGDKMALLTTTADMDQGSLVS